MLKIRYFIRLVTTFIYRFKGLLFVGIFLGALSFFAVRFILPIFLEKTTERIGITGRYRTDELPNSVLEIISDGLTKINDEGIVEPNLAETWETPDKGKTWIFSLKKDIYWQDDERVNSQQILYELSDVEVDTPDERTIIFRLQDAFSPFPAVVSRPAFKKGLLGTGEWRVRNISVAGNYIQKIILTDEKKNKKIYKFYPTEEQTKLAYKLGEVDTIQQIFEPSPFTDWRTAKISEDVNSGQVVVIFLNTEDKLLSERSFRQALSYSVDKEQLEGPRAISPISPASWAFNPQVKDYRYDKARAEELISSLAKELQESLSIKLVCTPVLLETAERIADYWEEVGVETVVQVSSVIPAEPQAYLAILDIPTDPDQYSLWHSTRTGTNICNYSNPRIDKLLEDGRNELDLEERRKIYLDFQRFLVEDSPAIFLYHPISYSITRK